MPLGILPLTAAMDAFAIHTITTRAWSLDDCLRQLDHPRVFACSTRGTTDYTVPAYEPSDAFLFGPETRGLPQPVLEILPAERRLRIPMRPNNRSLNLSNAAAVVLYEAWRQHHFR